MKIGDIIADYSGKAIPLPGNDIDTDRIIPARFMLSTTFRGLGRYAMFDERFDANDNKKDHPFNAEKYTGHSVLLVNKNFGCGSSREHAPWSLYDFGVRMIIGESFAEIFAGNCNSLGIPALCVGQKDAGELMAMVENDGDLQISADLRKKTISAGSKTFKFDMPESYRRALVNGKWDTTSILLENSDKIRKVGEKLPYLIW